MAMQITCDPAKLTNDQREYVAGFILGYPSSKLDPITVTPTFTQQELDEQPVGGEILPFARSGADAAPSAIVPEGDGDSTVAPNVPQPPAPPAVPTVPVPTAASPTNPVETDSRGFPWDHRIHSESKNKVADGTWRKKRGVDPALLATVEAELAAVMGVGNDVHATGYLDNYAPPSSAPAIPPAPAPVATDDPKKMYVRLAGYVASMIQAKKITPEQVAACCMLENIPGLPMLANRLDLVPTIEMHIRNLIEGA